MVETCNIFIKYVKSWWKKTTARDFLKFFLKKSFWQKTCVFAWKADSYKPPTVWARIALLQDTNSFGQPEIDEAALSYTKCRRTQSSPLAPAGGGGKGALAPPPVVSDLVTAVTW